mmetsp:Transcript_111595/g.296598  ORF Transcript_111595/g.296598 Transcript_111595/m.296598 type:complete len:264 (-) Transcript_111595:99-890(-)
MGNAVAQFGLDYEEEEDERSAAASSSARSLDDQEFCPYNQRSATIIFDWDDTLMCSSAIKARKDPDPAEVMELAEATETVLRLAISLGRTAIVTNANLTWVRTTAGIFMPSVVPLLDMIEVVSARQAYGRRCPGDHSAWKRMAFRDVVSGKGSPTGYKEPSTSGPTSGVNLVVVGDSSAEMQAGRSVVQGHKSGGAILKTVKLKEAPSVSELCGQLRAITRSLRRIVVEDRSASKLVVRGGFSASGWSVCDAGCGMSLFGLAV